VDQKALVTSLVCVASVFKAVKWQSISFVKISFFIKIEMMLRLHKLETFLFMFIKVRLSVILL